MHKTKHLILITATMATASMGPVALATDAGVSVSVGQPGLYGRIDIGDYPRPPLVYRQPIVAHPPVDVVYEPIYLHVPPGQAKRWRHYCGRYNACNSPVYFVQDTWYNEVYVPGYRAHHAEGHDNDHGHGHRRGHFRD